MAQQILTMYPSEMTVEFETELSCRLDKKVIATVRAHSYSLMHADISNVLEFLNPNDIVMIMQEIARIQKHLKNRTIVPYSE